MSDIVEKIYCCDRDNDNLAAAILAGRNDRYMPEAMMGGQWNNPFVYLVWMMFANRFFGNGDWNGQNAQNIEVQTQLQDIRSQMQNNQNSNLLMDAIKGNYSALQQLAQNLNCDFNTLQQCCCNMQAAIQQVSGQVGFSAERVINAANMGNCQVIQALKDCCCNTQKEILQLGSDIRHQTCQQTYELREGQRNLGQAISQGFSQVAFQAQQDKCDIIRAGQDNTQRIIDTLNNHWKDEQALQIQDLKFQLSQERQTRMIERMGRNGWGRGNDGCGCGCNDGCGC